MKKISAVNLQGFLWEEGSIKRERARTKCMSIVIENGQIVFRLPLPSHRNPCKFTADFKHFLFFSTFSSKILLLNNVHVLDMDS